MSETTSTPHVYLVVTGDFESHSVVSAHASFDGAVREAKAFMADSGSRWTECSTEEAERQAWKLWGSGAGGRQYGYVAIEAHELKVETPEVGS